MTRVGSLFGWAGTQPNTTAGFVAPAYALARAGAACLRRST